MTSISAVGGGSNIALSLLQYDASKSLSDTMSELFDFIFSASVTFSNSKIPGAIAETFSGNKEIAEYYQTKLEEFQKEHPRTPDDVAKSKAFFETIHEYRGFFPEEGFSMTIEYNDGSISKASVPPATAFDKFKRDKKEIGWDYDDQQAEKQRQAEAKIIIATMQEASATKQELENLELTQEAVKQLFETGEESENGDVDSSDSTNDEIQSFHADTEMKPTLETDVVTNA